MMIKTRTKITSVLEDVWRNREKLEEAEKKLKPKFEYQRQTKDEEIKIKYFFIVSQFKIISPRQQ